MIEVQEYAGTSLSVTRFDKNNLVLHCVIVIPVKDRYVVIQTTPCSGEKVLRSTYATREYAIGYAVAIVLDGGTVDENNQAQGW
jgi:hypothetical protein